MKKRTWQRVLAVVLVFVLSFSLVGISASAGKSVYRHLDGSAYTLEKVSNPDRGEGEVDGLLAGGDRASSYCWAMAENNGHLYIGTWANGLWQMVEAIASGAAGLGVTLTDEEVDSLAALITSGEVAPCEPDSYYTAKIYRYNETTGEVELLFDPGDYPGDLNYGVVTGFRAGVEFKGDVYLDALLLADCALYRVTDEDPFAKPEIVFRNGTLRAMCVSLDKETMFVGGSRVIPEGYLSAAAIYATTTGNNGDYHCVADEKDFAYYTKTGTTADISDMITFANPEYKNGYELIATLGTSQGLVIYRGHEASDEEIAAGLANEYGWVWTEFAGANGQYPISFGNLIHVNLNPVVFGEELYFLSMTNPMTPLIYLFAGLMGGNNDLFYYGLDQTALTCDIECSVYRLTKDGKLQMVMGDKEYCPDSIEYAANLGAGFTNEKYGTTMYAWRGVTYNDRLYINTIDYWNLFGYVTQLTNGKLLGFEKDELEAEIGYLIDFMEIILESESPLASLAELIPGAESVLKPEVVASLRKVVSSPMYDVLYALYRGIDEKASTELLSQLIRFCTDYSEDFAKLADTIGSTISKSGLEIAPVQELLDSVNSAKEIFDTISANRTHIENYMIISDTVAKEKNPGGEVWCTADGINWEAITRNGFNDKFNHGIRTFALGQDDSLYFGCANPYYGAQLWKCVDVDEGTLGGVDTETQPGAADGKIGMVFEIFRTIIDAIKNFFSGNFEIPKFDF